MLYRAAMHTENTMRPLAVSPRQAAALTSLSLRKIRELLSRGVLPRKRIGRRVVIDFSALEEFVRTGGHRGKRLARGSDKRIAS